MICEIIAKEYSNNILYNQIKKAIIYIITEIIVLIIICLILVKYLHNALLINTIFSIIILFSMAIIAYRVIFNELKKKLKSKNYRCILEDLREHNLMMVRKILKKYNICAKEEIKILIDYYQSKSYDNTKINWGNYISLFISYIFMLIIESSKPIPNMKQYIPIFYVLLIIALFKIFLSMIKTVYQFIKRKSSLYSNLYDFLIDIYFEKK